MEKKFAITKASAAAALQYGPTVSKGIAEMERLLSEGNKPNQILITFEDEETANYVKKVCRRKGTTLESYILDNYEWDGNPACFDDEDDEIDSYMCQLCEFEDICPDRKGEI